MADAISCTKVGLKFWPGKRPVSPLCLSYIRPDRKYGDSGDLPCLMHQQQKEITLRDHTSQNSFYKRTKISSHEITVAFFELKNDGKNWSRIYFEIHRAPSEIPARLPGQFGHSGQIFLHWAAATLKGLGQFQNKFQTNFSHHF